MFRSSPYYVCIPVLNHMDLTTCKTSHPWNVKSIATFSSHIKILIDTYKCSGSEAHIIKADIVCVLLMWKEKTRREDNRAMVGAALLSNKISRQHVSNRIVSGAALVGYSVAACQQISSSVKEDALFLI